MRKALWLNGAALAAAAVLAAAAPAQATVATIGSDGTFRVGVDIEPGVYTTTTAVQACGWARLSAEIPELDAMIETGGAVNGKATVEIKAGDVAFYTVGCGTWKLKTTAQFPFPTGSAANSTGSASSSDQG
ncbi:hypothetical protein [Nocardia otitidiscaviarum]|uniref:hypothetical protein n=1 Tax=Nocardia otitidiscaviarum TaxID=1823 RepID=UPI0024561DFB|nr:hypothetical protein [Nocardia otitidiscaviarum]